MLCEYLTSLYVTICYVRCADWDSLRDPRAGQQVGPGPSGSPSGAAGNPSQGRQRSHSCHLRYSSCLQGMGGERGVVAGKGAIADKWRGMGCSITVLLQQHVPNFDILSSLHTAAVCTHQQVAHISSRNRKHALNQHGTWYCSCLSPSSHTSIDQVAHHQGTVLL